MKIAFSDAEVRDLMAALNIAEETNKGHVDSISLNGDPQTIDSPELGLTPAWGRAQLAQAKRFAALRSYLRQARKAAA